MKKKRNNKAIIVFTVLLLVAMFLVSFFVISTTSEIGGTIGKTIGTIVGTNKGKKEGKKDGTDAGLVDPPTIVDVSTEIHKCGYLQIMEMDIKIADVFYIGGTEEEHNNHDYSKVKYAEYYTEDGIATFKIDLSNAEITPNLDSHIVEVNITNDVEIAINPNTNSLDTVDYYQEHGWTDSTEEGEEAFRNSYNKVVDKVKEKLSQNDAIMNEAKKSAKTQVSNLVKAICGGETNIRLFINGVEVQD